MADAFELDPVRMGQPVGPKAGGGRRPGQQLVLAAPDDAHGTGDPLPPLPLQYAEVVQRERNWLDSAGMLTGLADHAGGPERLSE